MRVEIVFAGPLRQVAKMFELPSTATIEDALRLAAASGDFAVVDLESAPVGIFGVSVGREHPLADGDRIEIYRKLAIDPKTARRSRAAGRPGR